jgi:hypothetical protein
MIAFDAISLDRWFPRLHQHRYVKLLMTPERRPVGLTRCRAEYFVRLWAYLWLKQNFTLGKVPQQPLKTLTLPQGFIPCTHREVAHVFYANKDRGSDRAAGMILDKLVALGLLDKRFNGNTICLQIRPLASTVEQPELTTRLRVKTDAFNPRTDAVLVANFLAQHYNWMNKNIAALPHRIARSLRRWADCYPTGMRVLRRCDTLQPIGFYLLYPTAVVSEPNFFLSPGKSVHLSATEADDPMQMANPGDLNCTSVFIRCWAIDLPYLQHPQVVQLLKDCQQTLIQMQADFPNLCDLYALTIHPSIEQLAQVLGFQPTNGNSMMGIYWVYRAIDCFLNLDINEAIASLNFSPNH